MKIVVVVAALMFVSCSVADLHDDIEAKLMKYFNECIEANEADGQELEDLKMDKIMPADVSENFKCAAKCVMDKYEVIDTHTGKLLPEEFKAGFTDEMAADELDEPIAACKDSKGENPCDTAFITAFCIMRYKN